MTLLCRSKRTSRQASLEELCANAKTRRAKKTAQVLKQKQDGWVKVDAKSYKWEVKNIYQATPGARIAGIKRTATLSDVFFSLLSPSVLVEIRKEVGKEKLYHGRNKVFIKDIHKMYAATLFLQAAAPHFDKGQHKNVFNEVYKVAKKHFKNNGCLGLRIFNNYILILKYQPILHKRI